MRTDRIFGLAVVLGALAYIASAFQLQTSFLSDPVGSKTFPIIVGGVAVICGLVMALSPDPEPDWPHGRTWARLGIAVLVLVGYAYALRPWGFLLPTALAAGIISYQINPRPVAAALTGIGLSVGLYLLFKYALGLGLMALPRDFPG